ncbi:LysM peptidoglycan-binding domain-containing protein [Quadrisphaera sp. DSM 44207]|uniref:LysM peptidoglycan-binding domain-containing protein n=1 Tax=Quadrisphaera sp. DSM 44207 TaxID=1881057 RepID=UPI0008878221|nr:LysM peptidoglycan-binding domain-containing protein [Quadrisphaera sp. DSM 44207]SDQ34380.1 LysM domain-containing protein [Quadrisphaera sp. DSM 44207]
MPTTAAPAPDRSAAGVPAGAPTGVPAARRPAPPSPLPSVPPSMLPSAPLRLTRRGRSVVASAAVLMAFPAAVGLCLVLPPAARAGDEERPVHRVVVTVLPGETLWSIAQLAQPDADPREVVAHIQELNGLHGAAVQAGQRLVVPAA